MGWFGGSWSCSSTGLRTNKNWEETKERDQRVEKKVERKIK